MASVTTKPLVLEADARFDPFDSGWSDLLEGNTHGYAGRFDRHLKIYTVLAAQHGSTRIGALSVRVAHRAVGSRQSRVTYAKRTDCCLCSLGPLGRLPEAGCAPDHLFAWWHSDCPLLAGWATVDAWVQQNSRLRLGPWPRSRSFVVRARSRSRTFSAIPPFTTHRPGSAQLSRATSRSNMARRRSRFTTIPDCCDSAWGRWSRAARSAAGGGAHLLRRAATHGALNRYFERRVADRCRSRSPRLRSSMCWSTGRTKQPTRCWAWCRRCGRKRLRRRRGDG